MDEFNWYLKALTVNRSSIVNNLVTWFSSVQRGSSRFGKYRSLRRCREVPRSTWSRGEKKKTSSRLHVCFRDPSQTLSTNVGNSGGI